MKSPFIGRSGWMRWTLTLFLLLTASSAAWAGSIGSPSKGKLVEGFQFPPNVHLKYLGSIRSQDKQWMTLETAALIHRAAKTVAQATGDAVLVMGEASHERGGTIAGHRSHRSGRDIDILFYATDRKGQPIVADAFRAYDGEGRCRSKGCARVFDDQRNFLKLCTNSYDLGKYSIPFNFHST